MSSSQSSHWLPDWAWPTGQLKLNRGWCQIPVLFDQLCSVTPVVRKLASSILSPQHSWLNCPSMYYNLTEINFSSLLGNHSQIPDWLLSLEENFRSLVFKLLEFFFFFLQYQNQTLSKQVANPYIYIMVIYYWFGRHIEFSS